MGMGAYEINSINRKMKDYRCKAVAATEGLTGYERIKAIASFYASLGLKDTKSVCDHHWSKVSPEVTEHRVMDVLNTSLSFELALETEIVDSRRSAMEYTGLELRNEPITAADFYLDNYDIMGRAPKGQTKIVIKS